MTGSCPVPAEALDYGLHGTAHKPMLFSAVGSTAVTFVVTMALIINHLFRYRCPKEQRQIIRLIFAPFVFSLVSLFEALSYDIAPYIDPIGDWYESFCLCALFLLYIQFAVPGGTFDDETFEAVKAAEDGRFGKYDPMRVVKKLKAVKHNWPRLTWICVFQYPILELVAILILEPTQAAGIYCVQSLSPKYGHLYSTIVASVGVTFSVTAIVLFYGNVKNRLKVRRGLSKLVCVKLIVGLRFFQSLIFSFLLDKNVIKTGTSFSYNDILYGLENSIMCFEMAILVSSFWYAYSATEYSTRSRPHHSRMPVHKAILDATNPWDILVGIGRMFTIVMDLKGNGVSNARSSADEQYDSAQPVWARQGITGQQKYENVVGMEPLSQPGAAYDGVDRAQGDMSYTDGPNSYQPSSGSPPSYQSNSYLMAERRGHRRSSSWDGQRYSRSPSPAPGRFIESRDMV